MSIQKFYLAFLVASVFLGTDLLAIPTPAFQLTLYRVLALSVMPLLLMTVIIGSPRLKVSPKSVASFSVFVYLFWYAWAWISGIWSLDLTAWFQAVFLLTLGVSSILALYFWIEDFGSWYGLVKVAWLMISLLIIWGFFEIITNTYFLADLSKLDKYGTFVSQPWTRMPITHFENQNDYATMLLAYFPLSLIIYYNERSWMTRILMVVSGIGGGILVFQTHSRLSFLSVLIYFVVFLVLSVRVDFSAKQWKWMTLVVLLAIIVAVLFVPPVRNLVDGLIYTNSRDIVSGDTGRVNLIRIGMVFLATSYGLGVGAGNIEYWMEHYRFLPTQNIVNMHNWWAEIFVGYGGLVFLLYLAAYALMITKLFFVRRKCSIAFQQSANALLAFLIAFVFASMTSSNNIFIEWHWVFFGLIVSFIKLIEKNEIELVKGENNESYNNH